MCIFIDHIYDWNCFAYCVSNVIARLYHALVHMCRRSNRPFLVLEHEILHTLYLRLSSKYLRDTPVANANGVLVRLICESSDPKYIRLC